MNDFFYKKLDAYQIAKELTMYVYSLLRNYPSFEQHALCDQLRRAVVSVPSNIAEGSESLGYITLEELQKAEEISDRLARVMAGLRKSLKSKINIDE
jgi:hypothetical protein